MALEDAEVQKKLIEMGTGLFTADQRDRASHARKLADDLTKIRGAVDKAKIELN